MSIALLTESHLTSAQRKPVFSQEIKMFAVHKIESWLNSFLFIIIISFQAHLPEIKVHAYFAPVTPPPSVHGGGQRLCRCCIILWQWRARGGHLCLQVLLLWSGLKWVGAGHQGRCRREEGLDPLTAPDLWLIHRLIATGPWSVEPAPPLSSSSQSCSSPGPDVEDGWGKQSWMDLCSLSVSLFLSRYKDKDRRSAPWHLDSWWWAGGRLNSRATVHHVLTNNQKKCHHLGHCLWSIISTKHMTPLFDHPFFCFVH